MLNLADALLTDGVTVTIFDNLSRPGAAFNLEWLRPRQGRRFTFVQDDMRDFSTIRSAVAEAWVIYHLSAQVNVLYVTDLVQAMCLAVEQIDVTAGQVYNPGSGLENALSVWTEFGSLLAELAGRHIPVTYGPWGPGDQLVYVSDTRKAQRDLGW